GCPRLDRRRQDQDGAPRARQDQARRRPRILPAERRQIRREGGRAAVSAFMTRALALAKKGKVSPNPMVGCVIVKEGEVIASAYHARYGGPHAEALALAACGRAARGATVYVTLEPCRAHAGKKTPPCVDALIRAKVARVVAACADANPEIAGRSFARLR